MQSFEWLYTFCSTERTENCLEPVQLAYLAVLVVGAVVLFMAGRRSRDMSTAVIALMPVAIALNIAVGATVAALRLPIYLDSIGTVLVGVLAGPWAGALTGLLSNLIWALLPVPGGAGPVIAFFAPVAAVIGLMAGFWASRGVFQLRATDPRLGGFLALALGVAAAGIGFLALQNIVGLPVMEVCPTDGSVPVGPCVDEPTALANQTLFVTEALALVVLGAMVAWLSRRTIFAFQGEDRRIRAYLEVATGIAAGALVFVVLRLLFAPEGYFSTLDGGPDSALPGTDLSGLAIADPLGLIVQAGLGLLAGGGAWYWASRGENSRLFPVWVGGLTTGLVAAAMSAPIAAGVFGGVTGAGTDALVGLYRALGLGVFQSAFAQGLTSDPLDKLISYTVVLVILAALPITVRTMFSRGESAVAD